MQRQPTPLSARLTQAAALIVLLGAASPHSTSSPAPTPAPPSPHSKSHAAGHDAAHAPSETAPAASAPAQPPHAWLFGTWTGGLFPAPSALKAASCLSQPVVIFTRDVVLRATLTSDLYTQRVIESVRTGPHGAEFRFTQAPAPAASPLDIAPDTAAGGFGCESPDLLHVERHSDNEIAFPGCAEFPYPLVRCPAR